MKNLLNKIKKSEQKNPALTAALKEIKKLNAIMEQAKAILDTTPATTTFQVEGEPSYIPTFDQLNDSKVDLLSNLLHFKA